MSVYRPFRRPKCGRTVRLNIRRAKVESFSVQLPVYSGLAFPTRRGALEGLDASGRKKGPPPLHFLGPFFNLPGPELDFSKREVTLMSLPWSLNNY